MRLLDGRALQLFVELTAAAFFASVLVAGRSFEEGNSYESNNGLGVRISRRLQGFDPLTHDAGVDTPFEWNLKNGLAVGIACVCALLANSAGIGGGPFYIPLFNTVLVFDLKLSTALSHTVVATSAVASTLYGIWQRHPNDETRSLIDFDIALILIPAMLCGVSFGVLFNVLIPTWLQTLLLTLLLTVVIRKTSHKTWNTWKSEQRRRARRKTSSPAASHKTTRLQDERSAPLLSHPGHEGSKGGGNSDAAVAPSGGDHQFEHQVDEYGCGSECSVSDDEHAHDIDVDEALLHVTKQQQHGTLTDIYNRIPFFQLLQIIVMWSSFLLLQMLKSKYGRCSWQHLGLWAAQVMLCGGCTAYCIGKQLRNNCQEGVRMDPEVQSILQEGEGSALSSLLWVAFIVAASGLVAGLLGIGGALIINPFLLALGVQPQVTASTAVLMILFSSSSISVSFYFQGLLNTSYASVFAPACFVSSLVGATLIGTAVRKTGRVSIILIILTSLIVAGTGATAVFGGMRAYENIRQGKDIGFHPLCT